MFTGDEGRQRPADGGECRALPTPSLALPEDSEPFSRLSVRARKRAQIRRVHGLSAPAKAARRLRGRYHEVVRLAREAAPEAMKVLIAIVMDPREDTRSRIVAAQEIVGRALGKIREMEPDAPVDLSGMSVEQLQLLLQIVQAAKQTEGGAGDE